jgi:hypothetical protein
VFVFIILWNIGVLARFPIIFESSSPRACCSDDIDVLTQVVSCLGDAVRRHGQGQGCIIALMDSRKDSETQPPASNASHLAHSLAGSILNIVTVSLRPILVRDRRCARPMTIAMTTSMLLFQLFCLLPVDVSSFRSMSHVSLRSTFKAYP